MTLDLGGRVATVVRALFLALALLLLVACWGPTYVVQQYAGPAKPPETIAVLRVNGADSVRLLVLDAEDVAAPVASDARLHFEILPGRHRLRAANANAPNDPAEILAFDGEAGRVYRVLYAPGPTPGPRVFEVDRSSDKPLRDVTLSGEAAFDASDLRARKPRVKPHPQPPAATEPVPSEGIGVDPTLRHDAGVGEGPP